jgi:hypothetical protein
VEVLRITTLLAPFIFPSRESELHPAVTRRNGRSLRTRFSAFAPPKMLQLQMTLYCVIECFPAERIEVALNCTRLTHRVAPLDSRPTTRYLPISQSS